MIKLGMYIDHENIRICGGSKIDYERLLEFVSDDNIYIVRAAIYMVTDPDCNESVQAQMIRYKDKLRYLGFKVVDKKSQRYFNEGNNTTVKANVDMELAIDVVKESRNLDVVVLVTGDGDFIPLVEYLHSEGKRVKVVGLENVSQKLKFAADQYIDASKIYGIFRK